jgi:hypothetical protein
MGLLDDAIREHLELKRLRGADSDMVSREESEVFGSVRGGVTDDDGEIAAPEDLADEVIHTAGHDPAKPETFSNVGQETAELDMRAVLDDAVDRDVASAVPATAGPGAARPPSSDAPRERDATDNSLEWEMLGDGIAAEESDEPHEGDLPRAESGDEPVEDVLEETPDFLRDTPEQERLWFEQRPPRDFDFDK